MHPIAKSELLIVLGSMIFALLIINLVPRREIITPSATTVAAQALVPVPLTEKSDDSVICEQPFTYEIDLGMYVLQIAPGGGESRCFFRFVRAKDRSNVLTQEMLKGDKLNILFAHAGDPVVHFKAWPNKPVVVFEHESSSGHFEYLIFELGTNSVNLEQGLGPTPARLHIDEKNNEIVFVSDDVEQLSYFGARTVGPKLHFVWILSRQKKLVLDPGLSRQSLSKDSANCNSGSLASSVTEKAELELQDMPLENLDQVLDLAYDGNLRAAQQLFNANWPRRSRGKAACWSSLMQQMKQSHYWKAVKCVNGLGPAPTLESLFDHATHDG